MKTPWRCQVEETLHRECWRDTACAYPICVSDINFVWEYVRLWVRTDSILLKEVRFDYI